VIEIADQCRNRWRSILPMFGVDPAVLTGKHSPCPVCEGRDRFRFDDKDGRGTFFCNQCGAGDGVKLAMRVSGKSFSEMAQEIRERLGETSESRAPAAMGAVDAKRRASALWGSAVPIFGDEAERYLKGRGLPGPYPTALRYCPSARVSEHPTKSVLPAMLALVSDAAGNPINVHRTYLEHGGKARMDAPRKMMSGTVPEGSAIRLSPHTGRLGVAEGIETALSVTTRLKIPCWSLIDAGKMERWVIPPDVTELHIFGDNDTNYVGQAAAYVLARRARALKGGPSLVTVHIPNTAGTDWADHPANFTVAA